MMRQMEFDADQYETRLAGSAAFEATSRQMTLLNVAASGARQRSRETSIAKAGSATIYRD